MIYLKKKRKNLGLSVEDVCKRLKVTPQFYYRIEKEQVRVPLKMIKPLIKVLDLKPHQYMHIQKTLLNFYATRLNKYFPQ